MKDKVLLQPSRAHARAGIVPEAAAEERDDDVPAHALPSNEKEISHGRVSWQARQTYFKVGPLASSIG
jgi:hypothetical protein